MKIKSKSYKTYFSPSKYANLPPKMWVVSRGQIYKYDAWFGRMYNKLTRWRPGGLATAFYLAAVRLSIIAPVRKSVNHSRTIVSMRETGWEQQQGVRLLSDSTVWNEFAFGPVGHCFLCCNQFLSAVMWSLRFPFFWSCVCHYMQFTTLRTRPVNTDRKQTLFLDAGPFDSLHLSECSLSSCVSV